MNKLFINTWLTNRKIQNFNEARVAQLLDSGVKIDHTFDRNDAVCMLMLDAASELFDSMKTHGVKGSVGLRRNYGHGYPGWLLIVNTDNSRITPLVAKYFIWERIESHDILSFEELMGASDTTQHRTNS